MHRSVGEARKGKAKELGKERPCMWHAGEGKVGHGGREGEVHKF